MSNDLKILNEILNRNSVRVFEDKPLSSDQVKLLMEAALRAPFTTTAYTSQFILVEDKGTLDKISCMRESGSEFLSKVPLSIVVLGSPLESERWVEDATLAAGWIQLQAENLGLSSCWVQVHGMYTPSGQDSTEYVRQLLDIPYQMEVLCIIGVGYSKEEREIKDESYLNWEKIHIGKYILPKED